MPTETETFQPSEIWTPRTDDFELEPAIELAQKETNSKNPEQLIHDLKQQVKRSDNGIVYALLKGDKPDQYSDTDALVMFNPFANTATANMLVRAEFIREVAKHADIRDALGKLKPVIMLASPGLYGSKPSLSHDDKKQIKAGNLGPAAKEYLKAVSALEFGHVALLGFSQGADLAIASGVSLSAANLDSNALAVGDPSGVKPRSLKEVGIDFLHSGPDISQRAKDSKLDALDLARTVKRDGTAFWASMAYPSNWNLFARNMGGDSFLSSIQTILDQGTIDKITIAYGEKSTITPPEAIEPSLARLKNGDRKDHLFTIKVKDGTHAWGEDLTILAKLYLKALV